MTGQERREAIVRYLAAHERARVDDLAQHLGVSVVTIRSDLRLLENAGYVVRMHGVVVLSQNTAAEIAFAERRQKHSGVKGKIGAEAARLVNNGDSIILDAGTTTLEIARHLKQHEALLVMTNGLDIAMELSHAPGVEIIMLGGKLRKTALSCSGAEAEASLSHHRFDRLFLGVDAMELTRGLTTDHENEASLNRAMIAIADEVVAVTDSSKADRKSVYLVSNFDGIDRLVTDDQLPDAYIEALRHEHHVEVILS
ncbi:transcriptional repressor AgaR [Kushneria phosphatilytica]|uniref:DeoR/GlpR transcriptional regulator n=1 Tax=Kushneria phosphatilytica TaxID=657387 RepID=A0A1S1NRK6_9GAMM|nr:transcriptional repressor AgaR [Kushneria phosphatilytica]OHV07550.1 DeoR family transcriptional regulator [Kushneria phosphatilytica]QEL10036.1 DeoR/GlpR transcriptional regulator [Kushneria phosphatilytica]